ncbi:ADP-ribosylglycohydrolase family protein [Maribacter sp. 2307UL18-2]|uniref:ADP-ribosylglycohydrolase family protein n=1 Tax=Maribacter sp. 2307UL18-2 TaxID=3386274 RepID=UPI0039BD8AE7
MRTIKDGILGLAIGDAIGVPVEFKSREELDASPVVDMRGYGAHYQPSGTWSDDSSLTFCIAEALLEDFSLRKIANNFILWKGGLLWTPHGQVFDIGIQTSRSIDTLQKILNEKDLDSLKLLRYEADEYTNGNGSLMRILPLYYVLKDKVIEEEFNLIWEVSALTHGHIRSAISCLIYLVIIDELMNGREKQIAYQNTRERITKFFTLREIAEREVQVFNRIIKNDIQLLSRNEIQSSGYVIHSLEASIWCFLNNKTYKETILEAVNLGDDTDTTAAIVGGLAGVFYGSEAFPKSWYNSLARLDDIELLCKKLELKFSAI